MFYMMIVVNGKDFGKTLGFLGNIPTLVWFGIGCRCTVLSGALGSVSSHVVAYLRDLYWDCNCLGIICYMVFNIPMDTL